MIKVWTWIGGKPAAFEVGTNDVQIARAVVLDADVRIKVALAAVPKE